MTHPHPQSLKMPAMFPSTTPPAIRDRSRVSYPESQPLAKDNLFSSSGTSTAEYVRSPCPFPMRAAECASLLTPRPLQACQAYLKALSQEITMQMYYTMPVPTSIIVIGCGSPALIPHYKAVTECPFPIFADPSRKLFKRLGMSWSLDIGSKRPEYMKEISPPAWLLEQIRQVSKTRGMKKFKGGNWLQIGGEFLFQNGQVIWCHRMKNYRGHAEIQVLKQLLEIES